MKKHIRIVDSLSGSTVITVPVVLNLADADPAFADFVSEAWRAAVEDRVVMPGDRQKYHFAESAEPSNGSA